MLKFLGGVASALLMVAAGFFIWKSRAQSEQLVLEAPLPQANYVMPLAPQAPPEPPAAPAISKEEKRFARADKYDDDRITRAELMQPRQKAFAKLDKNGNGTLSLRNGR